MTARLNRKLQFEHAGRNTRPAAASQHQRQIKMIKGGQVCVGWLSACLAASTSRRRAAVFEVLCCNNNNNNNNAAHRNGGETPDRAASPAGSLRRGSSSFKALCDERTRLTSGYTHESQPDGRLWESNGMRVKTCSPQDDQPPSPLL